jgi:hypothetical protein
MSSHEHGEKCSPEQKLEYLKRYMAYWIEHRHWERHDLMLHFQHFEAFGMIMFHRCEPLKTFDEWLRDTKRAEAHLARVQPFHHGLEAIYVPTKTNFRL